ncbi:MAG: 1-acyl-sn-glycerol-3-phosphate acyltransferase [Hyphomicrobiales bacterium]
MILRSILFNIAFYANLVFWIILILPTLLVPRHLAWAGVRGWANSSVWLLKVIAGARLEVRGLEKIPEGGCIVAAKHQSFYETFALLPLFADPAYIFKRELMWLPGFGWYLMKMSQIPVNRGKRSVALKAMTARAVDDIRHGRQIIIFPEGTRRPAGAEPAYKYGVAHLYRASGATVLPVALNSGLFWPRRKFERYPGTIVMEFLDPIAPGLSIEDFQETLQARIEPVCDRLIEEAAAAPNPSPLATDIVRAKATR